MSKNTIGSMIAAAELLTRHFLRSKLQPLGYTTAEYRALVALSGCQPASLGTLAKAIRLDNPTLSRMVAELATRGIIKAAPDTKHGRRISISLTAAGAALCNGAFKEIGDELHNQTVGQMGPEQAKAFGESLGVYLQALDAMSAPKPAPPASE